MIRLFFKTLWNNRKRNVLVFIELFTISVVLLNLTRYQVNLVTIRNIKNCYDAHNVILIQLSRKAQEDEQTTVQSLNNLKQKFLSDNLVESVSLSTNAIPYNYNLNSSEFHYEEQKFNLALRQVDIDYSKVMKITPLKGRWFDETDIGKAVEPIIISRDIDEKYFNGDALGKRIEDHTKNTFEIIGVTDHFKRSDNENPYSCGFFFQNDLGRARAWWGAGVLIRTDEGKTGEILATAESQVYSTVNPEMWAIGSLNSLENMRDGQNLDATQRRVLSLIITLFIMINVFMGVIGILWYNTNLRIHEVGIKRALGETGRGIKLMLLAENMFLAGLGLVILILIFMQIPDFRGGTKTLPGVFSRTVIISTTIMIFLVILSTLIPASIASKIRPADALKTE